MAEDLSHVKDLISNLPPIPDSDDEELDAEEEEIINQLEEEEEDDDDDDELADIAEETEEATNQFMGKEFLKDEGKVMVTTEGGDTLQEGFYGHAEIATFDMLPLGEPLQKALVKMGFIHPSKIQAEALQTLLVDNPGANIVGMAHHGSGKTATFLLAALCKTNPKIQECQCIILLPTRELAIQIAGVCQLLGKYTPHEVQLGIPQYPVRYCTAQILIGTPGRVFHEYCRRDNFDGNSVKLFIIDEADEMLKIGRRGRRDASSRMSETVFDIRSYLHENAQILLFSATFDEDVRQLSRELCPRPIRIEVRRDELTLDGIRQFAITCPGRPQRFDTLLELYSVLEIGQSIIFVNRVEGAQLLYDNMTRKGFKCSVIYGKGMDNTLRDRTMEDFRTGRTSVLISSDLLSRGIDVLAVTVVVNYDVPSFRDPACYVHRIGRSGRFGRKGVAINLIGDRDEERALETILSHYSCDDKIKWLRSEDLEGIIILSRSTWFEKKNWK